MGTSKAYDSPKWPGVNSAVGDAVSDGPPSKEKISNAVGAFAKGFKGYLNSGRPGRFGSVSGGLSTGKRASGGRGSGSGTTSRTRAAAAGARLGNFLSVASSDGLNQTLEEFNLGSLVGRSLEEVLDGVLDMLCGDGGLLDDASLNAAMARTIDELAQDIKNVEEFDNLLTGSTVNIEEYIQIYYANVLAVNFEQKEAGYVRDRLPHNQTERFFSEARELITAIVKEELSHERDLITLDWNSSDGIAIADAINQEVLDILITNDTY